MTEDLNTAALTVAAAGIVAWSVVSARVERYYVSAPIAFVAMGLLATHGPLAVIHVNPHTASIRSLAELTLALVLFTDGSRVNVHELRHDLGLPVRLLLIGLPLTIGFGTVAAFGLLSGISIWVAATIAAIVAPTDAALGASILEDRRIPPRIRRLLNVESGLNDGIATPFVNLFLAGAIATEATGSTTVLHAARGLLIGAGVGIAVGAVGGWLVRYANQQEWSAAGVQPLAAIGLAFLAYGVAVEAAGNGFISTFVAGIAFGTVASANLESAEGFAEQAGGLLSLLVWLIFGGAMLTPGFEHATWQDYLFAVLALTVIRMIPVAIALLGVGLDPYTVGFVGWFGPRGLASVVFGLIAYDTLAPTDAVRVLSVVTVTVALSVIAHGLSAPPLAARYGAFVENLKAHRPEQSPMPHMRARTHVGRHPGVAPLDPDA